MRIAQIAPIAERVPPKKYGGTERVIYHLTEELVKMGHDVTLFASGDSITSAKLISVYPTSLREANLKDIYGYNTYSVLNMGLAYSMQKEFDVIHDHNPHMGLPTANLASCPTIMTWHGPYEQEIVNLFSILDKPYVASISNSQGKPISHLKNYLGTVYNGLNMEDYVFSSQPKDYLLFVGRISMEKGVHYAIDAAVKTARPLIIAAKLDQVPQDQEYFKRYVRPRLRKYAKQVQWIGEVDEGERNKLMSNAYAFVHPVTWPEPFGLTLIESMACGCPVVAFNQGSIPEIIEHGKTGFVANDLGQLLAGINEAGKIDRAYCRSYALKNFSARKMAQGYLDLYELAVALNRGIVKKPEKLDAERKRQKLFLGFGTTNT